MPTLQDIKAQIIAEKDAQSDLQGLNSTSNVAIYNLWAYCVAVVIWLQYQFYDQFKADMNVMIREQKQYSRQWFRTKALAYRHGEDLPDNSDEYPTEVDDTTNLPITNAAVEERELQNRKHLFIKVATGDDDLAPVTDPVKTGLEEYFAHIKPAGTKIILFSEVADDLKLVIRFYYNPLILDNTGARLDGTDDTPVQNAIRRFLKSLPFNSELRLSNLIDTLQDVDGCADRDVYIDEAYYRYGTLSSFQPFDSNYFSNAGYMVIDDNDLDIQFISKNQPLYCILTSSY